MREFRLQAVVNRVERRLLVSGLKESIVRYRVEGQIKELVGSFIQRCTTDGSLVALSGRGVKPGVLRIRGYAKSQQLLDQCGLGRIPIAMTPNVNAHGANIGCIDDVVTMQFALDAEIPVIGGGITETAVENKRATQ